MFEALQATKERFLYTLDFLTKNSNFGQDYASREVFVISNNPPKALRKQ